MKKLLAFLAILITYNVVCAQTTIVNQIQVNSAKGSPPSQVMPVNGGLAYYDVNGFIKKSDFRFLLGKKVDSLTRLNDSTIQVTSQWGQTYNVTIRGLYDLTTKGFVDSLRTGLKKDTSVIRNIGTGTTLFAFTTPGTDTLMLSTMQDTTYVGLTKHGDGTIVIYDKPTGVAAGTYGDQTHSVAVHVDGTGKVTSVSQVAISGVGSSKRSINNQTATYNLVSADSAKYIVMNSASKDTIFIPVDTVCVMPPPATVDIYQAGGGAVVIQPISSLTTVSSRKGRLTSAGQYAKITLNKISANNWIVSGDLDTTSSTYLVTSLTTLPGMTATFGSASAPDSFTVSGFFLIAGATITAPTNFETSLDKSSWGSSKSISLSGSSLSGQPVWVYVRITSSAPSGSVSGTVTVTSTGAATVSIAATGSVGTTQSAIFNFSSSASAQAGATNFTGDPTTSPTATDANTGWILAAIGANWTKFGGFYGGVGNGSTSPSTDGTFTQAQINSNLYTLTSFSPGVYNLQFTNLPAGTYDIIVLGSIRYSVFNNQGSMEFHVQFGSGGGDNVAVVDPNAGTAAAGNLQTNGPSTTNVFNGTFTGTITTGQVINICISKGTGAANTPQTGASGQLGFINAIKIVKH